MSCCPGRGKFVLAEISLILVTLPLVDLLSPVVPRAAVCPPAAAASPSTSAPSEPPSCQGSCRLHWLVLGEIQPCTEKAGVQELVGRLRPAIRVFWPRCAEFVCATRHRPAWMCPPALVQQILGLGGPNINKKISNHWAWGFSQKDQKS